MANRYGKRVVLRMDLTSTVYRNNLTASFFPPGFSENRLGGGFRMLATSFFR